MKVDCELVQELYALYQENELSTKLSQHISDHLNSCEQCRNIFEEETGFVDLVQLDQEMIQPDQSLDERLRKSLLRQKYYRYFKTGLLLVSVIVCVYFLFFRFTFIIGSTDLSRPSFAQDYQRIKEKFNISDEAKITHMGLQFTYSGLLDRFSARIVDFYDDHLDIYDLNFSPSIYGLQVYRVKYNSIQDPYFIPQSPAQLPADKLFRVLNQVDYGNMLATIPTDRYFLSTDAERKDMKVNQSTQNPRQYFVTEKNSFMIEQDRIVKLEAGQIFSEVYHLLVNPGTDYVRSYIFR